MPRFLAGSSAFTLLSTRMATGRLGARKFRDHRRARLHAVGDGHLRPRADREVDIHARAEADEAVALAAREAIAGLHVAQDATRDEPRDLHAGNLGAVVHAQ